MRLEKETPNSGNPHSSTLCYPVLSCLLCPACSALPEIPGTPLRFSLMEPKPLVFGALLAWALCVVTYSHLTEEGNEQNPKNSLQNHDAMEPRASPPVSIVAMTKGYKKISRKEAEKAVATAKKKNKKKNPSPTKKALPKKAPRPSPPANCVATGARCRPPSGPCCDPCAFCHCRLFQTICFCRVLNPHC
ncbi:agouti-signaling protein [Ornithorhynchus anatinus]|uniref:agouti-signaling protein n=1 Tax=Ornithorhynchus anatinus TaxID=9258 RepID=UPI0010A8547C|nr:agouti-signaling protein [Ornithorhynchus anatinus]